MVQNFRLIVSYFLVRQVTRVNIDRFSVLRLFLRPRVEFTLANMLVVIFEYI
jgi:hypothetical protein